MLTASQALMGVITPNVRRVCMSWETSRRAFTLRAYFKCEPTETEVENFEVALTDVAANYAYWTFQHIVFEYKVTQQPFYEVEMAGIPIYQRYGEIK